MPSFDAIVIGMGQAGPSLVGRLASAGMRVAVVERKLFGGTCVNTGCTPTKALVASARAAWMARRASEYGVDVRGPVTVDMRRVKARKDAIVRAPGPGPRGLDPRTRRRQRLRRATAGSKGRAGSGSATTTLDAERIFINVGGRARVPDAARPRRGAST